MKKFINIIIGAIITVFGLFLLFNGSAVNFFAMYIGILFLLVTIVGFILMKKFKFAEIPYGQFILTGVFGLVFIFLPNVSFAIIVTLFTVIFFLFSVFYIIKTFRNNDGKISHLFQIALSIIFIVYAVIMLLNPKLGGQTLSSILSVFMIVNGISYFFINTEFIAE